MNIQEKYITQIITKKKQNCAMKKKNKLQEYSQNCYKNLSEEEKSPKRNMNLT